MDFYEIDLIYLRRNLRRVISIFSHHKYFFKSISYETTRHFLRYHTRLFIKKQTDIDILIGWDLLRITNLCSQIKTYNTYIVLANSMEIAKSS